MSRLVFASAGTDHHPFNRLVDWVDAWYAEYADRSDAGEIRCLVQYGTSRPPGSAEGRALAGHEELMEWLATASVVVCHGGPATITESRRRGRLPVVVPRSPRLGEHVDDHQERFCHRMADKGLISLATSEETFRLAISRALAKPEEFAVPTGDDGAAAETAGRFGQLVDELFLNRRR